MKLDYFVLSQGSSIDAETNSVSIFGLIEEIQMGIQNISQENDNKPFQLHIIASFSREDTEIGPIDKSITVIASNPAGNEILRQNAIPVHFEPIHKRARIKIVAVIPVSIKGKYLFKLINSDGLCLADYSFYLSYIVPPQ